MKGAAAVKPSFPVLGALLAGGQSSRMGGGDKTLRPLGGKPILDRVVDRVRGQTTDLILNANGDPARFSRLNLPVVADVVEGFAGPLAGILTALEWCRKERRKIEWVASLATDAPFLPMDLVARLADAVATDAADVACAKSGERTHPVFAIWPVRLAGDLRRALVEEDMRKIDRWTERYRVAHVEFDCQPVDPFFNINRPENLAEAETLLALEGAA